MAVLWALLEAHEAYAEVRKAYVEAHRAHVEVHKAYVEVHEAYVEVHKAHVEVHRTLANYRNPRTLSQGRVQRLSKHQYIRLVLLYRSIYLSIDLSIYPSIYLLTCCPSLY